MSKSLVIAVAFASLVTAGTAIAADVSYQAAPPVPPPPTPTFSWTGFYVGAHAGPGWSLSEQTFSGGTQNGIRQDVNNENNYTGTGFLGGAQAGFNYQVGPWVWGVEAQFSWADLDGKDHCIAASPVALLNCDTKANWLGTAAARIGFASDRTMIFVKGGGAWVHDKYDLSFFAPPPRSDSVDQTRSGWVFGTGVEYAFYGNWSAKVEYDYLDLGTQAVTFPGLPAFDPQFIGTTVTIRQRIQLVKFGLNYRFGDGAGVANY
jgi:outer membrane immunogenic protein